LNGARYGGTLGPGFLLLIPAAFLPGARMRHRAAVIAACGAYLAVWASPISSFQLRFVIPLVPLLAVLGALGAERIGPSRAQPQRGRITRRHGDAGDPARAQSARLHGSARQWTASALGSGSRT
jgi:hypothetical protein